MTTDFETAAESLLIRETPEPEATEAPELEDAVESQELPQEDEAEEELPEDETGDDEPQEEEAKEEAPSKFTVKVDGTDVEVTLDDLKRSYSGQAYIQKGMKEAAEAKKAAMQLQEALQTEQSRFLEFAQMAQKQGIKSAPTPPDYSLAQTDPIGYMQADAEYRRELADYQTQQTQIQNLTRQREAMTAKQKQEFLNEQREILTQRIPEFADKAKASEITSKIVKTGLDAYGFTEQELGGVMDARHIQVLYDAARYRELQAVKAQPRKVEAPKTVKPAARQPQPPQLARVKQLEQAKKSGKTEDFVSLLLEKKR